MKRLVFAFVLVFLLGSMSGYAEFFENSPGHVGSSGGVYYDDSSNDMYAKVGGSLHILNNGDSRWTQLKGFSSSDPSVFIDGDIIAYYNNRLYVAGSSSGTGFLYKCNGSSCSEIKRFSDGPIRDLELYDGKLAIASHNLWFYDGSSFSEHTLNGIRGNGDNGDVVAIAHAPGKFENYIATQNDVYYISSVNEDYFDEPSYNPTDVVRDLILEGNSLSAVIAVQRDGNIYRVGSNANRIGHVDGLVPSGHSIVELSNSRSITCGSNSASDYDYYIVSSQGIYSLCEDSGGWSVTEIYDDFNSGAGRNSIALAYQTNIDRTIFGYFGDSTQSSTRVMQSDIIEPDTTGGSVPSSYQSDSVDITLGCSDRAPGKCHKIVYCIYDPINNPCNPSTTLTDSSTGFKSYEEDVSVSCSSGECERRIRWKVLDRAGLESNIDETNTISFDNVDPDTTTNDIDNNWHTSPYSISVSCTDGLSGCDRVEYSIDFGNWQSGSSFDVTCNNGNECSRDVRYRGVDNAGNVESSNSGTVKLDERGPSVNIRRRSSTGTSLTIDVTFSDSGVGMSSFATADLEGPNGNVRSVNNGEDVTYNNLEPGVNYCFSADTSDKLGNSGSDSECFTTIPDVPGLVNILSDGKGTGYVTITLGEDQNSDSTDYTTTVRDNLGNTYGVKKTSTGKGKIVQGSGTKVPKSEWNQGFEIHGLSHNEIYDIRATAYNSVGSKTGNYNDFRTLSIHPSNISLATGATEIDKLERGTESCGNNICEAGEEEFCPADCRPSVDTGTCNENNICEAELGETETTCPSDCKTEIPGDDDVQSLTNFTEFVTGDDYVDILFRPFGYFDTGAETGYTPGNITTESLILQAPDGRSVFITIDGRWTEDNVIVPFRYYFNGTIVKFADDQYFEEVQLYPEDTDYSHIDSVFGYDGYDLDGKCFDHSEDNTDEVFELKVYGNLIGAAADGDWVIKKPQEKFTNSDLLRNSFIGLNVQEKVYTNEDDCEGIVGEDNNDFNPITIWDWENDQEKSDLESYINQKSVSETAVSPQVLIPNEYYQPPAQYIDDSEYEGNYIRGWISRNNPITITFPDLSTMTITCRESYCPDEQRKYFELWLPEISDDSVDGGQYCFDDEIDGTFFDGYRDEFPCSLDHPDFGLEINGTILNKPLDGTWTIKHEETEPHKSELDAQFKDKIGPGNAIELNIRNRVFSSTTENGCLIEDSEEVDGGYIGITYSENPISLWNWHETDEGSEYCEYNGDYGLMSGSGETNDPTDPEVSPVNYRFYLLYSAGQGVQEVLVQYTLTNYEQLCRILDDTRDSLVNGYNIESFCRDPTSMQKACEVVFTKEICNDYIIDITGEPVQDTLGGTGLVTATLEDVRATMIKIVDFILKVT